MLVVMKPLAQRLLQAALAAGGAGPGGPLHGAKVMLYTQAVGLDGSTQLSDLTEADYPGYAQQAVVWGGVVSRADGAFVSHAALQTFQMTDATAPTNIAGYGIVSTDTTPVLLLAEQFDDPYPLVTANDALVLAAEFAIGAPGADYGSATVLSS